MRCPYCKANVKKGVFCEKCGSKIPVHKSSAPIVILVSSIALVVISLIVVVCLMFLKTGDFTISLKGHNDEI